jgi:hypothetical protein
VAVEKSVSVSLSYSSVKLTVDDVRAIESVLTASATTWRVAVPGQAAPGVPCIEHWSSSALDDLVAEAPKGRLFRLEVEAERDGGALTLEIPARNSRSAVLSYEGPGEDPPAQFLVVNAILHKKWKRGRYARDLGSVLVGLAFVIPLMIFDQVGRFGLFYDETRPPHDVSVAITLAVLSFLLLAPICVGVRTWATASVAALRPAIDTASIAQRVSGRFVGAVRWMAGFYRADDTIEKKILIATSTGAFAAVAALIVALLAWLAPR